MSGRKNSFYRFSNPHDEEYAQACRLGTWEPDDGQTLCPECGIPQVTRVRPLIIEWEPGSDLVGDFTFPGLLDDIIVSDRVRSRLHGIVKGAEFSSVIVREEKKSKRGISKSKEIALTTNSSTEPLWDMFVTGWCHLNVKASHLVLEKECKTCHFRFFRPPKAPQKLVLDGAEWHGENVFKCFEFPAWVFCLEDIRSVILEEEFTNVTFKRIGELSA